MQYRPMGRKGPNVPILGFGAMRLPILDGDESKINEPEAIRLIRYAIDHGATYVDTAWGYHFENSERCVGRALADGYRDKTFLATKLPSWFIETREDCDKYLNEQLARLQTDHIDFYLLHALKQESWDKLKGLGVKEFLETALKDGRIKYAGFSFHDKHPAFKYIADDFDWTFCQIQYNFMDEEEQAGTQGMKYAAERGLGVIVMEPLRGGNLSKEPPKDISALWDTAAEKRTPAEWALRWVWNHPEVTMLLSGMNEMDQVKENIALAETVKTDSLTPDELALIGKVRDQFRARTPVPCTTCGYCMPCPAGVNIPMTFRFYNEAVMYENPPAAARVYNLIVKPENQASACTECGECEEKCPQEIQIREQLKASRPLLEKKQ